MTADDHSETFVAENQQFAKLELDDEDRAVGKLEDINLAEDEVWLMQCPKGMDVRLLEGEKLKIPGRTNLSNTEAVSVEYVEGVEKEAFAYCNRKGKYAMRLLPIRGTIILRNRLKAADIITDEHIKTCCPPAKRVPVPANIRVRHPLLGHQFAEKLELDDEIRKRLREADNISAKLLKDSLTCKSKPLLNVESIEINSDNGGDETDVQFVSEVLGKKKKHKRKHSESKGSDEEKKSKKKKPVNKCFDEQVSEDLQWLQNL